MRTSYFIRSMIVGLLPVAPCVAEVAEQGPTRDAVTHEELVERARKAPSPTANLKPVELKVDPAKANRPGDLLERSDILCYNNFATLVPKSAILHRPKQLQSRLGFQTGSKIQVWSEFLAANRGWISTVEVSRPQAEGNEPLPEETQKSISKSPYIIVATYRGGPISVLPKKEGTPPPAYTPKP